MGRFTEVENYLQKTLGADSGELQHSYRVLYHAAAILEREPPCDTEVVCVSALLHDIGRVEGEGLQKDDHAQRGAILAAACLQQLGWPQQRIEQVAHCIQCHRRKGGRPPQSPEAKILYDADKLDLLGAAGLARMLQFAPGLPLYGQGHNGTPVFGKETKHAVYRKCMRKIRKVVEEMYTETGRLLARERAPAAQRWLQEIRTEVERDYQRTCEMGLI